MNSYFGMVKRALRVATVGVLALGAGNALANEMLVNGGFEAGFAGWTQVSNRGGSGCDIDWYVSATDTQCQFTNTRLNGAVEGNLAAYNSFDGAGPLNFTIEQDVTLGSVGLATLAWSHTVGWNFGIGSPNLAPRLFNLSFLDAGDNLIGDAFTLGISQAANGVTGMIDWTANSVDVTGLLAGFGGQTVTLVADIFIPENFSGPGSFGLDGVSLVVEAPVPPMLSLFALLARKPSPNALF